MLGHHYKAIHSKKVSTQLYCLEFFLRITDNECFDLWRTSSGDSVLISGRSQFGAVATIFCKADRALKPWLLIINTEDDALSQMSFPWLPCRGRFHLTVLH